MGNQPECLLWKNTVNEGKLYHKEISIGAHFLHRPSLVLLPLWSKNHNYWSNLRWLHNLEMEYDVIQKTVFDLIPYGRYHDTLSGPNKLRVISQEHSIQRGKKTHKQTNITSIHSLVKCVFILTLNQALGRATENSGQQQQKHFFNSGDVWYTGEAAN